MDRTRYFHYEATCRIVDLSGTNPATEHVYTYACPIPSPDGYKSVADFAQAEGFERMDDGTWHKIDETTRQWQYESTIRPISSDEYFRRNVGKMARA